MFRKRNHDRFNMISKTIFNTFIHTHTPTYTYTFIDDDFVINTFEFIIFFIFIFTKYIMIYFIITRCENNNL